jgi:acyl transferase domain-containing protein
MAGRFPGASSVPELWELIRHGREGIRRFSAVELAAAGVSLRDSSHPDYVPAGGVLEQAECFDADFFGYGRREATLLDPQQRVFLECAWHGLEDAGIVPSSGAQRIGVYAGASINYYLIRNLLPDPALMADVGPAELMLGNEKDTLATRTAYHLDLKGPAVTVQSACSTSLVAVHLAIQALRTGDCDVALAGGVCVQPPQTAGYRYVEGGLLSPDGHCRPFDAAGRGSVVGNGVAVVVLRPLVDALRAGDQVHAVILGSAVGNDGAGRFAFTAPGVNGQAAVIRSAHHAAGVDPGTIGYCETHGTATPLGEPVEVAALRSAFEASNTIRGSSEEPACALGSVKALLGHLNAAAGVTGLIKTVLAVREGLIPPSPHFREPNPEIALSDGPFYVPREPVPWPSGPHGRRAGVSSIGMGETTAHVIVAEPPIAPDSGGAGDRADSPQLLLLSARSEAALGASRRRLGEFLAKGSDLSLADVAYTLRIGRRHFEYRAAVPCVDIESAAQRLISGEGVVIGTVGAGVPPEVPPPLPGGATRPARTLTAPDLSEPTSRDALDAQLALLTAAARLWTGGAPVDPDWLATGDKGRRISLPGYPFARDRYWNDPPGRQATTDPAA